MYGKRVGIALAVLMGLLVVAVLTALPALAYLAMQQNAHLNCQRAYLSSLSAVLAERAQAVDQENSAQAAELQVLLDLPDNTLAVTAARKAYAAQLAQIMDYQNAHPVPPVLSCV